MHNDMISRIAVIGIAVILALSPIAWWPLDPYGLIKNVIVEAGVFILAAIWLCASLLRGELRWKRSPFTLPLALLTAWACCSFAANPFRAYGAARLRELFSYILIYLLALNLCGGERRSLNVFAGALIGMLAVSLTGLAQHTQLLPTRWADSPWGGGLGPRIYGTMLNPNMLAGHIIAVFPLGLSLFLFLWKGIGRLLGGAILAASFACLLLTVSWGGYAGFLAGIIFLLFLCFSRGRERRVLAGKGPVRLAVLLLGMAVVFFYLHGKQTLADTAGMRARFFLWRASGAAIGEHPLIGHGPGNTPVAIGGHLTDLVMREHMKNPEWDAWRGSYRVRFLDGDFFGAALELGLVGLALLTWLFAAIFLKLGRSLRRNPDAASLCALLGLGGCAVSLLVQSTVSYPLRVPPTAAVFFALLGIAAASGPNHTSLIRFGRLGRTARKVISLAVAGYCALLCMHAFATLRGETLLVQAFNFARQGRWKESAEKCEAASRYPVTDPEAYNIWGDAMLQLERPEEAASAFGHMLRLAPSRPDTYGKLGMIYESLGDYALALSYYRRAVSLERHDTPQFRVHLARLLSKTGETEEARRILSEGMRIYPNSEALRTELTRLNLR